MAEKVPQWEYLVETFGSSLRSINDEDLEEILNSWGEEGWQVFSLEYFPNSSKVRVVARRPATARSRRQRNWPNY